MKKALVIGASGFVGAHLLEQLTATGKYVVHATKTKDESMRYQGAEAYDLDMLDAEAVKALLRKVRPDHIFHLAAQSSVARSWTDPAQTYDVNVKGGVHLLEAVRALLYAPRLLLIGSGEEYGYIGADEGPVGEDHVVRPTNPYAATKASQNMLGRIYAEAYRMDVLMVRAFNHFGPGQSTVFVVSDLCKQVAEIEKGLRPPVLKVGNLSARRDFTDVRDVVRAYVLLMEAGKPGETYNVGSGTAIAVKDLLDIILSLTTAKVRVELDETKLRPVDMPVIAADIRRLVAATGWKPSIRLEQTVKDTLEEWRKQVATAPSPG
jgi:GDP-4-dehydro-6-deoxy-D-mannose reductase